MSQYRSRDSLLLAGVEATSGTEESLTVGNDAVLTTRPEPSPSFEDLETDETTGSLDDRGPIAGGGSFGFNFDVFAKGAGTAGQAPEYGPLLRGAALSETLLAADITGTAASGGSNTITLASGDGANVEEGMVIELTGGTGSGQTRVVTDVDGDQLTVYPDWDTEPDATSEYTVHACALYKPASSSLETCTLVNFQRRLDRGQARRRRAIGAALTGTLTITNRQLARFSFTATGQLPATPDDVSDPGDPTYDDVRPRPFMDAHAFLAGTKVRFRELSLDLGNTVQQPDDPAAVYGFDVARVTQRRVAGTINPIMELLSVRDFWADFFATTTRQLWTRWGDTGGNRVSVYMPELLARQPEDADLDGFAAQNIPFRAPAIDRGWFYCVY